MTTKDMTNNTTLRQIMGDHDLTQVQIAELLLTTHRRVNAWCCLQNPMPDNLLELLRYKLGLIE